MIAAISETDLPADVQSDSDAVLASLSSGKPLPAEVARRVRARALAITEEVRRKHGVVDIGVPAIRELRDA